MGRVKLLHPAADEIELSAVLHALSDPQRLVIVRALAESPSARRCGSFHVPVTKSTLTHHFRVLREAGVIDQQEDGTARLNSLRREDLDRRFPGLLDAVLGAPAPTAAPPGG
ncbi:MAG: ArsR/SmtB family transcription factor [Solirubrobacteraceae bacterium]